MYTYRYHVLTMVGIFLALGIGLMLGAILSPDWMLRQQVSLLHRLETRYDKLTLEHAKLKQQSISLHQVSKELRDEMEAIGMHYAANKLSGKHVVIVNAGQIHSQSLTALMQDAGGIVDGILTIGKQEAFLQNTLHESIVSNVRNQDEPGYTQLAEVIGQALTGSNQIPLQSLVQTNLISLSKPIQSKPDAVILVGGVYSEDIKTGKTRAEQFDFVLADQLRKSLPVVEVERSDSKRDTTWKYRKMGISTINNIDHIAGQIACIDILNGMQGHFGTGRASEALLPDLHSSKEVFKQ